MSRGDVYRGEAARFLFFSPVRISPFSPPSLARFFESTRRDSAIDPLAPRIAPLDFVQGGHLLRSLFPPPANHVFLACQGIVSSLRRGERLVSNLENTKLNRRRSLSPSFFLSPLFFNLRTRFVKLSYESIIRGFKFTRNFESSLLVFLSLARERRVKQSHSTELHLMLSV